MSGFAENNVKLAIAGGIYFFVAMIVATGFTLRGAEVRARSEASMSPARQIVAPLSATQGVSNVDFKEDKDAQVGTDTGGIFAAGSLMEPALELAARKVRRVVF